MKIKIVREVDVSKSYRTRQLESIFDVPAKKKSRLEWRGDFPYEKEPWNVGLIVGPSGCGKSTVAQEVFLGANPVLQCGVKWSGKSVIDDFDKQFSIRDIAKVCSAVGFNTIPAWLRPYRVLSTGEKFRVELARHLLEDADPIVVDEFTSVVDRQVAKIGAHAVQKYVRKNGRKFVAVSCHYDIIDWLQPDWIFEPATMKFTRRSVRRRPEIECTVQRIPRTAWASFAPYHYLTAGLPSGAVCYGLFVKPEKGFHHGGTEDTEPKKKREKKALGKSKIKKQKNNPDSAPCPPCLRGENTLVGFCGVIFRPGIRSGQKLYGVSRIVVLPDWQGLGLAFVLMDFLGACHKALGRWFHNYPTHPGFVYAHNRSPNWSVRKRAGVRFDSGRVKGDKRGQGAGRHNAVFRYTGPAAEIGVAEKIIKTRIKF